MSLRAIVINACADLTWQLEGKASNILWVKRKQSAATESRKEHLQFSNMAKKMSIEENVIVHTCVGYTHIVWTTPQKDLPVSVHVHAHEHDHDPHDHVSESVLHLSSN